MRTTTPNPERSPRKEALLRRFPTLRRLWGRARKALRGQRRRLANSIQLVGWDRAEGPPRRETAARRGGVVSADPVVPVVLCVWRRLHRLPETIALLERQEGSRVELHVWNNAPRARALVDSIAQRASGIAVHVTHSSRNVGGFGRFYVARALAARHPFAIFIDDDIAFSSTLASDLIAEAGPRSMSGHWAFHLESPSDFSARSEALPGELVDYCGTGGMVTDTSIFLEPALFQCPRRFWFIEDLWLSYFASQVLGWELRKSSAAFQMSYDGVDQFVYLRRRKSAFLRHLVEAGWALPRARSTDRTRPSPV